MKRLTEYDLYDFFTLHFTTKNETEKNIDNWLDDNFAYNKGVLRIIER